MADKQKRHSGLDIVMSGGQRLDPAIKEVLSNAVENKAALTAKQRRDRKRAKVTYDVAPPIQQAVESVAKKEDTSSSQIAALFLAFALQAYASKDEALLTALDAKVRARTPRFSWNLHLPDKWMEDIKNMRKESKKPTGWGI